MDSVTLQEGSRISLEWKRRLWHVFVSPLSWFWAHFRRTIGFYDYCAYPESAYNPRTIHSIHRRFHLGFRDFIHLLFPDLRIPDEEWRLPLQTIPIDLEACYKSLLSVRRNLHGFK